MALGAIDERGNLAITTLTLKPVYETKTREEPYTIIREVDGRQIPEARVRTWTYQDCHYTRETRVTHVSAGNFWVHQDSKLLDANTAAELLSHSTPIVLARGEPQEQLDPFYLQFFKPGTVIVGMKADPPTAGPPPGPVPVPPATPPPPASNAPVPAAPPPAAPPASYAPAPPAPRASAAPPPSTPQLGLGAIGEHGNLEIATVVTKPVWETKSRVEPYTATREFDGHQVPETRVRIVTYQVCHYVGETRLTRVNAGEFWVYRDSELLDTNAAAELLSHSTPIVFGYGKPQEQLDPFYLRFFKPGTVIVEIKAELPTVPVPVPTTSAPPVPPASNAPVPAAPPPPSAPPVPAPAAPPAASDPFAGLRRPTLFDAVARI
jgi:hypothetical protein